MEFIDVVKNRQATRKFSDKKVDRDTIMKILEIGKLAPTAKNMQPQLVIVVTSREGLEKIDKASPCRYNAQAVLIVCSDKSIACTLGTYSTYEMDASIVATHLMLGATSEGVDNIWIEYFDKNVIKKEFSLESDIEPICLIPLGYRASDCPESPGHNNRKPLGDTTRFA